MSSPFGDNDLAGPSDLTGLPGAPFTDAEVDAAVAAVRAAAGWHIAPVRADVAVVLSVEDYYRTLLRLPTRKLLSVEEIRDAVTNPVEDGSGTSTPIDDSTYRVITSRNAVLKTSGYWPYGLDAVEVDYTHGYSECPPDLLPVIAEAATLIRRDASARTLIAGPFQLQIGAQTNLPLTTLDTLDRYMLVELGAA